MKPKNRSGEDHVYYPEISPAEYGIPVEAKSLMLLRASRIKSDDNGAATNIIPLIW